MNTDETSPQRLDGEWHDWSGQALPESLGRGALYGDGFFTTCRLHAGRIEYADLHLQRLINSSRVFGFELPSGLEADLRKLALSLGSGVLKIYIQRLTGDGAQPPNPAKHRGYAPHTNQVQLAWQFFEDTGPLSAELISVQSARSAVVLKQKISLVAEHLAGLKTAGRIDQVLAAAELADQRVRLNMPDLEGITLDLADQLCEGVSHNLCLLIDGDWVTPILKNSGIHGVLRAALLKHGLIKSQALGVDALERADAAVLINSVRGLIPLQSVQVRGAWIDLDARCVGHLAELIRQKPTFMSDILC